MCGREPLLLRLSFYLLPKNRHLQKVFMKRKEAPGVRGARNEIVCVLDLLRQGFVVYRNVAPHGSSDVLALKRGRVVRVQIKSEVGRHGLRRNDVLAVVSD